MPIGKYGLALLVTCLALAFASMASAQREYHMIAKHSGKCFNVPGGATADKTRMIQWECGGGNNDNFIFEERGNGYYSISPAHAPRSCLDIDWNRRSDNGVQLELYRCNGGDNQLFQLRYSGGEYFQIVAKVSGKCLDVSGENRSSGAAIVQWDCKGGGDWLPGNANQFFKREFVREAGGPRLNQGWAYVFMRPEMPPLVGHTGWGFQLADGTFYAGAIEGTSNVWVKNNPSFHTAYTFRTEGEMLEYFRTYGRGYSNAAYTDFKKIAVANANPAAAMATVDEWKNYDYWLWSQNCMDETNAILGAYGLNGLPAPSQNWFPRDWFRNIRSSQHGSLLDTRNEHHMIAKHSGKCFNVPGGATADKTRMIQWDCGGGDNDNFIFEERGNGYYSISPAHAPRSCLDIDWNRRSDNGVQLELYRCNGGDNQIFRLRHSGVGYFQIVAKPSGKCLDVSGRAMHSGAAIVQWECNGQPNQFFRYDLVKVK